MIHLVCVVYAIQSVICSGFSLCYAQDFVCVMYGIQSVLCTGFSLCYVRNLVCVCMGFSLCYVQSFVCLMCSIWCLWLAAEAARLALMTGALVLGNLHRSVYI